MKLRKKKQESELTPAAKRMRRLRARRRSISRGSGPVLNEAKVEGRVEEILKVVTWLDPAVARQYARSLARLEIRMELAQQDLRTTPRELRDLSEAIRSQAEMLGITAQEGRLSKRGDREKSIGEAIMLHKRIKNLERLRRNDGRPEDAAKARALADKHAAGLLSEIEPDERPMVQDALDSHEAPLIADERFRQEHPEMVQAERDFMVGKPLPVETSEKL